MPSLPAIPPSPSAPPSLIYFLSRMYPCSLKYSSSALWHARENTEPAQEPGARPQSHTAAHVAHRRHPLRAPYVSLSSSLANPVPMNLRATKSASSTDMNAHRHQPRQPAQTPPASSLHLRPRVQSRLTSIRDVAVHTCAESSCVDLEVESIRRAGRRSHARTGEFESAEPEHTRPRRRFDSKLAVAVSCRLRPAPLVAECEAQCGAAAWLDSAGGKPVPCRLGS
ncbi:hypothetical protein C8R43DRAFT_1034522 [Mycena crocata]|nr:hypothetical protein C8R43DRAFT_1034476 [Mycena crocata]KAJ7120433.1 hypothetical protein C8R43DRAFT_1034522 [Mycena crocata]